MADSRSDAVKSVTSSDWLTFEVWDTYVKVNLGHGEALFDLYTLRKFVRLLDDR